MNLMDMLSADPPSSLYSPRMNGGDTAYEDSDEGVRDQTYVNGTAGGGASDEELPANGVFYLPTILTRFQQSSVDLILQLFSSELLNEVKTKRLRTSIDSLLESTPTASETGLNTYEKISLIYEQLMKVNCNPSLLVDHFIPKKILLSETNERQTHLSGKSQLFNRIVDSLIDSNKSYPEGFYMLVVAGSVKELELIEGLIIGKRLYYENYSSAKLYDDKRPMPNLKTTSTNTSKLCLNLITSQQLYNNYLSFTTKKSLDYNMIFSFDFELDVDVPSIQILRPNPKDCPIFIPMPIYSIEHIAQQFPKPLKSLNFSHDTSDPMYKYKLKVINALVINKFHFNDIDCENFFVDNYGSNMEKFKSWLKNSNVVGGNPLKKYTDKIALSFTDDKLIKKLNICFSESINGGFDSLGDFDYKSYRSQIAEALHGKLFEIQEKISQLNNEVIPEKRKYESSRQSHYDDDEDLISSGYRKLRKLNEQATVEERTLCRIESDLVKVEEISTEASTKLNELKDHTDHVHSEEDLIKQKTSLEELHQELAKMSSEFDKLNQECESLRSSYQLSSATAVQLSTKLDALKQKDMEINKKINGQALTSLPALIKNDALLNYESQLNRLQKENQFMSALFNEKIDKLYKERQVVMETSNSGSSSRPSNRVSRSSTPLQVRLLRDLIIVYFLYNKFTDIITFIWGYGITGSIKKLWRFINAFTFSYLLKLPPLRNKVEKELTASISHIEEVLMKNDKELLQFPKLPDQGYGKESIVQELDKLQNLKHSDWNNGRVSGAVYHGGQELLELQSEAYHKYAVANQLHPDVFPGVRKMEAEVVSMVLDIFNAPETGCGSTTSGGTESLLLTGLAAREYGRRYKGITRPEIIAPVTIHAGIDKACFYFGMTLHKVDLDPVTYQVDISKVKRLINKNTVLLVGSAPNYPHGIIDDIEELSKLAVRYNIPLHVDACLGSFIVSFLERSKVHGDRILPKFDFRLPGVTSISCDTHKYGFAPKGSSIIMYRNSKLRECQYYISSGWTGGMYGSPTLAGSRPGALMVGCWATLVNFGKQGYEDSCRNIVQASMKLKAALQNDVTLSNYLEIIGDPIASVISFKVKETETNNINIYELGDLLNGLGWHFSALQNPAGLHFAITKLTIPVIDDLVADLVKSTKEAVGKRKSNPKITGDTAAMYGVAGSVQTSGVADRLILLTMVVCSDISFISHAFSFISCFSWMFAQLPQIIQNYKGKSAEGISPLFLLLWFMGDFLSFTSCLLNQVLGFQVYLSIFFLCNDVTLCFQYYYYNSVYPRKSIGYNQLPQTQDIKPINTNNENVNLHSDAGLHIRHTKMSANASEESVLSSQSSSYDSTSEGNSHMVKAAITGVLLNASGARASPIQAFINDSTNTSIFSRECLGLVLAWGCTIIYCSSRCPQLYKNYKRKSVEGISPILFGAALLGNLTYTLSIVTSCEFIFGDSRSEFIWKELPYIIGSAGTILFDIAYFYQNKREFATIAYPTSITQIAEPQPSPIFKPSLRNKPFTPPWETEFLSLPIDHPHNPLIDLTKEQISKLEQKEYRHLNNLAYGTPEEMSGFCLNIIQIIEEKITEDPRLVSWLFREINDDTLRETIKRALLNSFREDKVKLCIFNFIIEPTSSDFRLTFFSVLGSISNLKEDNSQRSNILLNFLEKLSRTNVINTSPLLLRNHQYYKILQIIPPEKRSALFSRMVCVNLQPEYSRKLDSIKKGLFMGSELERLVSRTGLLSPKWHDLYQADFAEHKERIIEFYKMQDLAFFCNHFVGSNDPANSLLYLKFLLEKYERKWSRDNQYYLRDDTSLNEDTQTLLYAILNFVTVFKGVSSSGQILKYLSVQGFSVDLKIHLLLMKNMRLQGYYKEAIMLMNNIDLNGITETFKAELAKEIMLLMKAKYPSSAKVIIGYAGSLYDKSEGNLQTNKVLNILDDLKLLGVIYGNGKLEQLTSMQDVKLASVDANLAGNKFNTFALSCIYSVLLSSTSKGSGSAAIQKLFEEYMRVIKSSDYNLDSNDQVIGVFLNHLLKKPDSNPTEIQISTGYENFAVAKNVFEYYEQSLTKIKIDPENIDLLIQSALLIHKDFAFAIKVMKLYRKTTKKLTFIQMYSFIKYHYDKSEFEAANHWYDELVRQGPRYKGHLIRPLFDIARKMNWEVLGYAFKWNITKKNRHDREALSTIHSGELGFLGQDFENDDMLSARSQANSVNFGSELAATLHDLNKQRKDTTN
ncbi:Sphingosine-1-phosphate lyase [Spathaspora sp. JA1]|nr:Sphingosine-1-phosphate lyase [Spathaspora sp. JA1]